MNSDASLRTNAARRVPPITVEVALWILVGVLALVLRLANLDAAPLAAHEAREAMLAWRAVTGQGMPDGGYSPFLFVANALLFALCGAGDALARLWSVLFGTAFVLTPLLFRQRLGRVGVLAAGLYLAISPMALFASRQLDGAIMVALGGAVFFGGGLRFVETGGKNWLILAAGGLALAVTSGPSAFGMLLSLGLACLGFGWSWPIARVRWLWARIRPHFRVLMMAFFAAFVVLATGLGWNLRGVGAAGDLLSAWFSRFGMVSLSSLGTLIVYEPLAVLSGLFGLAWLVWKGRFFQKGRFGLLLGLWVGVAVLILSIASPQMPARAVWIVLPLALLGGVSVEVVAQNRRAFKRWRGEWIYACIVLVLWVYLYLRFASYGRQSARAPLDLIVGIIALVLPLLLLVLAAIGFAAFTGDDREVMSEIVGGARVVLWGTAIGAGVALLLVTFSIGWGCAHVRPADPRELLVYDPTADEVHDLVQTLRDLSWRETGLPTTLKFAYEAPADSVLAWYLRDFDAARRVDDLQEMEPWEWGGVVVTLHRDWAFELPEGIELVGRDFALRRSWSPHKLACALQWPPCNESIEWLFYRRPTFTLRTDSWFALEPEAEQWAVVWAHTDDEDAHSLELK